MHGAEFLIFATTGVCASRSRNGLLKNSPAQSERGYRFRHAKGRPKTSPFR